MISVVARLRMWRRRRRSPQPYADAAVPINDSSPATYAVYRREPAWHLSAAGRAALAEVIEYGGGTPDEVVALRDNVVRTSPYMSVDIWLGAELQVVATHAGRQPRLMIAGHGVEIDFAPANDDPTTAEVDAMDRLYDGVAAARDLFRAAHQRATHA